MKGVILSKVLKGVIATLIISCAVRQSAAVCRVCDVTSVLCDTCCASGRVHGVLYMQSVLCHVRCSCGVT